MITGFIYKIYQYDKCYIGMTFRTIRVRYIEHKNWSKYGLHNRSKCIDILFNTDIYEELPKITELYSLKFTEYNKTNINKLKKFEYQFMEKYKTKCLNKIKVAPDPDSYFQKNKDLICAKNKLKRFICTCGSNINFVSKNRHLKSAKHLNFVNCRKIIYF